MEAYCLIRDHPWYRRQAFMDGLKAVGLSAQVKQPSRFTKDTVLVIWNRYNEGHQLAMKTEAAGGTVIVAENGYIGRGGGSPKFQVHPAGPQPHHYYSLSRNYHNGGGTWFGEDNSRLEKLVIDFKPMRTGGDYILVCPNRSFGVPGRMMHPDWDVRVVEKLRRSCPYPVKIRPHPQNNAPKRALSEDLAGARAVVIWSSTCGVHALVDGIPVICAAPYWICKPATYPDYQHLDALGTCEDITSVRAIWEQTRLKAFQRLAWSQWTCEEISNGEPFRHLLPDLR